MNFTNIKSVGLAVIFAIAALSSAQSASISVKSTLSVGEATARLETAIEKAGARMFAKVDYQKGARSVGTDIRPTTIMIFGSPKIGADAFVIDQTIGLHLPLRILAHEDVSGQVWLTYLDPAEIATEHGIPVDHPAIVSMQSALKKLTRIASGQ